MNVAGNYGPLDRMLHRVAFSSPVVQLTAADIEHSLYGRRFDTIRIEKPVFITSLPRAGTTLLLDLLGRSPALATCCYRDMPFVLSPLLWERLSKLFRKPAVAKERAHGDGMQVSYDSPEAFEEVLWRAYWPGKFRDDGIALWTDDDEAAEFREAFVSHMRRIVAVRSNDGRERRYVSKNNANIARLELLKRLFGDAVIVVPFRRPLDQAASLLHQHLRFLERHRDDPFAREYMEDVGHLEFGALHRPIRFRGIEHIAGRFDAHTINYWLAYWTLAFEHIVRYHAHVVLVSYERLCDGALTGLRRLACRMGVPPETMSEAAAGELRPPRARGRAEAVSDDLLRQAEAVHDRLSELSIV